MTVVPWRQVDDGLRLSVRLTPRGGRDGLDGVKRLADGRLALKLRVKAAPTDGEANAALIAVLARLLQVPRSRIAIVAGATARLKTVAIAGEPENLAQRLGLLLAAATRPHALDT